MRNLPDRPNPFYDDWEKDFDKKKFKHALGGFIAVWVVASLLSLSLTLVVIWAIIRLVTHYA